MVRRCYSSMYPGVIMDESYTLSHFSDITAVEQLPKELLDSLDLVDIERETQAILTRIGLEELQIQGHTQMSIAKASSIICNKYEKFKSNRDGSLSATTRLTDPTRLTHFNSVGLSDREQGPQNDGLDKYGQSDSMARPPDNLLAKCWPSVPAGHIVVPKREESDVRPIFVPPGPNDTRRDYHDEMTVVPERRQNIRSDPNNVIIVPPRQTRPDSDLVTPAYGDVKSSHDIDTIILPSRNCITYTGRINRGNDCRTEPVDANTPLNSDVISVPSRTSNAYKDRIDRGIDSRTSPIHVATSKIDSTDGNGPGPNAITVPPRTKTPVEDTESSPAVQKAEDNFKTPPKVVEVPLNAGNDTVDIMQKLGYDRQQITQIIQQLGPNADNNDILGALVNQNTNNSKQELLIGSAASESDDSRGVTAVPSVVRDMSDSSQPGVDDNLRSIIIDGSNVAMSFGNKDVFACKGIEIVVNWFLERGHREIYVFVPNWRKESAKPDTPITDQHILEKLNKLQILVYTPSRRIGGRRIVCYDDRYIIKTAANYDGIVVSNDNFRDLQNESPLFKKVIEERLLLYSFVGNQFMPPDDPLGRHGPSLDNFLRKHPTAPDHPQQICPYGKKCTYGNKCKYYHPERQGTTQKSISEKLKEQDQSRKRSELVKALLNDQRDEHTRPNMHNGAHTEPIRLMHEEQDPRRTYFLERFKMIYGEGNIRDVFAKYPQELNEQRLHQLLHPRGGAGRTVTSRQSSTDAATHGSHRYSQGAARLSVGVPNMPNRHEVPPHIHHEAPPHIHHGQEGYFYSQPLPHQQSQSYHHEERLRSIGLPGVHQHGAPSQQQGITSQDRDLHEAFAQVSLGGNSAAGTHRPSSMYPKLGPQHNLYRDGAQPTSNSAPIRRPEGKEQRSYAGNIPSHWHRGRHSSSSSAEAYSSPHHPSSGHHGHHGHPGHPGHPDHPALYNEMYPHLQGAIPRYTSPQEHTYATNSSSIYPNLSNQSMELPPERSRMESPHRGSPNTHHSNPLPAANAAPPRQTNQATRRTYFMMQYRELYSEDNIRKVFERYPDETDERVLHQRLQFI